MINKILVPVDFSEGGNAGLRAARDVAVGTGAELVLLHVDEVPDMPAGEPFYIPARVLAQREAAGRARLERLLVELQGAGLRARARFEGGPVHQTIMEVASTEKPDLIVMGTHGRRGLAHMVMGSVTERMTRTSLVPVLSVRSEQPSA